MERHFLSLLRHLLQGLSIVVVVATAYLVGLANGRGDLRANVETAALAATSQAWAEARARLESSGLLPAEPELLLTIGGVITAIDDGAITLAADPVAANPLTDPEPETRTVVLSPDTKIVERTDKSPEEMARDETEFSRTLAAASKKGIIEPPLPYAEKEIDSSLLAVGDRLLVEAATDIKNASEIQASRLIRISSGQ